MRNPIGAIGLSLRAVISLAIVFIILLSVFVVAAWLTNSLQLPAFLLPSTSQNVPLQVSFTIDPQDSLILLDDKPYDPSRTPLPGDYTVKVTHDGYLPVEEEIRIHPSEENQFVFHLIPIATTILIARDAKYPGWDQMGDLFYLSVPENQILQLSGATTSPVVTLEGEIFQLVYLPSGGRIVALIGQGPEAGSFLKLIDAESAAQSDLAGQGFVSLGVDGETLWGINFDTQSNAEQPIWKLPLNGSQQLVALENAQWAMFGTSVVMDPSGQWIAIESSRGTAIWDVESGAYLVGFDGAFTPIWISGPQSGLVFVSSDGALKLAQPDQDWSAITLIDNIQKPVVAKPGGPEVIFTRYNPFEGGTSFWAVDTQTGGIRLLAEARTESGRVQQISVSVDGKRLAFINQHDDLFLVTLEP